MEYNSLWFKENVAPKMTNFNIQYRLFPNGDFGALDEVNFESEKFSGTINYWGNGFLGLTLFDNIIDDTVINVLIDSNIEDEKMTAIENLLNHVL